MLAEQSIVADGAESSHLDYKLGPCVFLGLPALAGPTSFPQEVAEQWATGFHPGWWSPG